MFGKHLFKRKVINIVKNTLPLRESNLSFASGPTDQIDLKLLPQLKKITRNTVNYKDGYACVQIECKVCCKKSNTAAFVNKVTSMFFCPTCEFSEKLINIFPLYDNEEKKSLKEKLQISLKAAAKEAKNKNEFKSKTTALEIATPKEFQQLELSIPESALQNIGAKYADVSSSVHFPLKNIIGMVVGEKILHLKDTTELTHPENDCSGVLKFSHSQKDCNKAVIVLNVLDFLAVCSQKIDGVTIICLPYWLKTLPQKCLPNLEQYKQLILWFDFDAAGWDITRHFARKLDERRCLFVRPTDEQPTPYEAVKKQLNLKAIIAKAQPILHKSITTFSTLKQDVLCELQNIEKVHGVKWKRYPVLNKLLKGHRKGELTILTGPTGSGKTTFMSEYSLDLAVQGVTTLWGSFEIRNTRLATTLLRQFVGYPLDEKLEEFDFWAKEMEKLPIYFMTFHGQQSIKVVMEAIEHAQYVHDIQHVIIDNVQFMLGISSSSRLDKFWEQDSVIAAFRTFATKRNVHVTLVMHPRKERDTDELTTNSIFGSAKATQEADNVLIIQDKRLTSVRGRKYLQIAKNRYSGDLGIMPLEFNKDALSYTSKKTKSST